MKEETRKIISLHRQKQARKELIVKTKRTSFLRTHATTVRHFLEADENSILTPGTKMTIITRRKIKKRSAQLT